MFLPDQRAKCLVRPGTSDNTAELDADSSQNDPSESSECVEVDLKKNCRLQSNCLLIRIRIDVWLGYIPKRRVFILLVLLRVSRLLMCQVKLTSLQDTSSGFSLRLRHSHSYCLQK